MKCLILAGGKGTRLKPLTHNIPKQLVPVANRPILHFVLDNVIKSGLREIGVIVAPETKNAIRESLEQYRREREPMVDFTFIVQDEPLGLAHAVKVAKEFLKEEPFLMYLGDNLIGQDLSRFIQGFQQTKADAFLLLKEVPDPSRFGVASLNEKGEIVHLEEKPKAPKSNLALIGVYIFSSAIHKAIEQIKPSARGEYEITHAIQVLIDSKNKVKSHILDSWWLDTGKKDTLLEANRIVLDNLIEREIKGRVSESSLIEGRVVIEEGSEIKDSQIRGPAVIGKNTKIIGSEIEPGTAIGDNCWIENSLIKFSIILEASIIRGIKAMDCSVIGRNARVIKNWESLGPLRLFLSDDSEVEI